jgi:hypothetical protein
VDGTTAILSETLIVGAKVASVRLANEGNTVTLTRIDGANPLNVRLATLGMVLSSSNGANVVVDRLAVEGTTLMLSLTAIVGAKVETVRV